MPPRQSLRRTLPLLISALLGVLIAAVSWSAYRQIEHALVSASGARLTSASVQLAAMLETSTRRVRGEMRRLATDSALTRYVAEPTAATRRRVTAVLEQERARSTQPVAFDVWSTDGRRLLAVGSSLAVSHASRVTSPATRFADSSARWVGPLVPADSGVAYTVAAPLLGGAGDTLGFIVAHRRLSAGQGAAAQIGGLIGSNASLLVGNADGSLWSDLSVSVAGPRGRVTPGVLTAYGSVDHTRLLGVGARIEGTPWAVWIQIPRGAAVASAHPFLLWIAGAGLLCVALGTIGAWLLSRRVTAPLVEVSRAAEDMARGDYTRRVATTRHDELGSLARSFNSMAAQVDAASRALEARADELEAANQELRVSEERAGRRERHFRALIESASDMICVLDADGRQSYASPSHERFVGFVPEELEGANAFDYLHPDDVAGALSVFERLLARPGEHAAVRFRHRHKDGSWRELAAVARNRLDDPSVGGIVVNSTDVTEQLALEAQLLQAQKMEAVGQLAGGVAHDFNNLLTVVTSYSGLLLEDLPQDAPARDDVHEIRAAAERAAVLTRQLLAFSRQQVLQPRALDLNAVVHDIEKMLGRVLRADVCLEAVLAPALGRVYADPGQLEQVIVNLVLNARDAMPAGGALTIETSDVELDSEYARLHADVTPGAYIMLAVSDTGTGMDAATRARIFEPFFTTKETGQGTGLGLSTVYGIVRQSGGHIAVYSEPGLGTTFKVYLPRNGASNAACDDSGSHVIVRPGSETILLVEDDEQVRAAASRILTRSGYVVLEAATGVEALRVSAQHCAPIDLLLTDMVMPEMSGRELASQFRVLHPETSTAFMSGYTEDAVLRQGAFEPGITFISKPFTPQSLTEKLRAALDGAATSRTAVAGAADGRPRPTPATEWQPVGGARRRAPV